MGREAICTATWQGATAEVKVLLESTEIILRGDIRARIARAGITGITARGDIRARIARAGITGITARGDNLAVDVSGDMLTLELGPVEATKWAAALLKAPPTLVEKLGLAAGKRAFVLGVIDDAALAVALDRATAPVLADADMIVAILRSEADISAALDTARTAPACAIWMVAGKGKFATVADAAIRGFMRANGYVDTKTSGISYRLTATRYTPR